MVGGMEMVGSKEPRGCWESLSLVSSLLHFLFKLGKLEAFFGFLLTIMALTFGYEVSVQTIH
jgi:hypothetical protein